ncbi:MAG TPA: response regulator [Acidimicrobiales bacterium]|nr:response regulator [Acidimicrobiales bacterium]
MPKRVVVVDNDPDALELVVLDLGLEGHEIVGTALDGDTALELVVTLAPDVLVVDHRMPPGPWGLEVAEIVRREHPDVEVVLYTNHRSAELEARTTSAGARLVPKGNLRSLRRAVAGG